MAYEISISEHQRAVIVAALTHAIGSRQPLAVCDEDAAELAVLQGMFHDLPAAEAENPGCLHGFCL